MKKKKIPLFNWALTSWQVDGHAGWKQQPVIIIEKQAPFFADHPDGYIKKLQEMHDDPQIARSSFYALIGQFKDALEQVWIIGDKK